MRSLDRCPSCGVGRMTSYTCRTRGSMRTTYLKCDNCGQTGKQLSKVDHIGRIVTYLSTSDGTQVDAPKPVDGYDACMEGKQ
jgi:uncharacterized Zn finger protein